MIYSYNAKVMRVVDADTVDLSTDLGFRIYNRDRFRLYGINAPERGQAGWFEGKAALEALLPIDTAVRIETQHPTQRDPKDKYGRWLATIYTLEGMNVNQWLVEEGYAVEFMR